MRDYRGGKEKFLDFVGKASGTRMCFGMAFALLIVAVLIIYNNPGAEGKKDIMLSQAMLSEKAGIKLDSQELASRVVEQKFQIHMEETNQQMGEIPYVEVWVLNDPFYPLIGDVGDLRKEEGFLSSKEWQMLDFPNYKKEEGGTTTGTASTSQSQTTTVTSATAGTTQRVLMLKEVYEIRGIRYATIKVNDQAYDKLKVGSDFADVFRLQEIKDSETVVVLCGDETYELKVNQLRKV